MAAEILRRHEGNPILTRDDWPYPVNSVFNAGAARLESGETVLLARVEDRRGISHLAAARSRDGVTDWRVNEKPALAPDPEGYPQEAWGIEDPRITFLPEAGRYAVVYTRYGRGGPGVGVAFTEDFERFERKGMVLPPDNKDAAIFPRRFGGRWAMIHRPSAPDVAAHMWICFSPDLLHWGDHKLLMEAREGARWDAKKVGLCCPPVETEEGWLLLYHGVKQTAAGHLYRMGLALLAPDDPTKVLRRGDEWVFSPETPYERTGDVSDVVFSCGCTVGEDGETLNVYYGAADTALALATARLPELLDWLRAHGRPESP